MKRLVVGATAALLCCASALAQDVPLWQRLIRWSNPDSSETAVPTTMMGRHMQMSERLAPLPGDAERARNLVDAAARVLARYRDVATAERDGYRAFAPRGIVGEEVHYTNYWIAGREKKIFDPERPGSLLYQRQADGSMRAVGVMYSAKAEASAGELDVRVPLSIGVWHRHVHFCGWPSGTPKSDYDGPQARFGFAGSIGDEAECKAAGGYWLPLVLGWMTHIYPFESDPERVWLGEHAMHADAAAPTPREAADRADHRHEPHAEHSH